MVKKPIGARKKADTMRVDRPPTKEEKAVVHWVRQNVPTKKTRFLHSHIVDYFIGFIELHLECRFSPFAIYTHDDEFAGSKAVDALVNDSPWSAPKSDNSAEESTSKREQKSSPTSNSIRFVSREDVVDFMDEMLKQKFFHRADKITVNRPSDKKDDASSTTATAVDSQSSSTLTRRNKSDADKEKSDSDQLNTPVPSKGKRKVRLDMHLEQVFHDSSDAYVWIYNPMPWYYWLFGSLIVLGLIVICMFPLWPDKMRVGVHYLSLAGAGFIGFIMALACLKYLIFVVLYGLSGGRLSFWMLPNLTEDVGFLESFWPLYDYTYTSDGSGKTAKKRKSKRDAIKAAKSDAKVVHPPSDENHSDTENDDREATPAAETEDFEQLEGVDHVKAQ